MPTAVVPAAGQSSRFGAPKLLADIDGAFLVDRAVCSLLDAGISRVIVVCAAVDALARTALARDSRVRLVVNPRPERGMFSSVQVGVSAAAGGPCVVLPGDMPFVRPSTVAQVLTRAGADGAVVVPAFRGRRGHPIFVPGDACAHVAAAEPLSTLKDVLLASGVPQVEIDVDDPGVTRDVDVPGDLALDAE